MTRVEEPPTGPSPEATNRTAGTPSVIGNDHPALGRAWLPVALASEVTDQPARVMLLGQPWVVVRLGDTLLAAHDRCPHRLAPLSLGAVDD